MPTLSAARQASAPDHRRASAERILFPILYSVSPGYWHPTTRCAFSRARRRCQPCTPPASQARETGEDGVRTKTLTSVRPPRLLRPARPPLTPPALPLVCMLVHALGSECSSARSSAGCARAKSSCWSPVPVPVPVRRSGLLASPRARVADQDPTRQTQRPLFAYAPLCPGLSPCSSVLPASLYRVAASHTYRPPSSVLVGLSFPLLSPSPSPRVHAVAPVRYAVMACVFKSSGMAYLCLSFGHALSPRRGDTR
ncbi:hypothetical protein AcV5_005055 [Taiwanofungus camphoratus]|nr:hypothetical protein AcV5_005055 [Antrodia cinnamomea]